jgi:hypothetical protein
MEIASFEPDKGPAGTQVKIKLNSMPADASNENTAVYLGDMQLHEISVDAHLGEIAVHVADGADGSRFSVDIRSQSGNTHAEAAADFEVTESDPDNGHSNAPKIQTVSGPGAPPYKAGDQLTLRGDNLDEVATMRLGTRRITKFRLVGSGRKQGITFSIPTGLEGGSYILQIEDKSGGRTKYPRKIVVAGDSSESSSENQDSS